MKMIDFDAVLCVAPKHKNLALRAVRSLEIFSSARNIFIITSSKNFSFFKENILSNEKIKLLDEDLLIENISLSYIKEYLNKRINSDIKSGWYFQQFLKMAASNLSYISEHYLIWDSDTVLLRPLEFFDELGRVCINPNTENHLPYFKVLKKLLGIEKQVDYSFISEHLIVNKKYMNDLISSIKNNSNQGNGNISWVEIILDAIDDEDLNGSGFSEFEIYGNYIAKYFSNSFLPRPLSSIRTGTEIYGVNPNKHDLYKLMQSGYFLVSFEDWHYASPKRVALNKLISCSSFWLTNIFDKKNKSLNYAKVICK